jgi:flagellar protein FliO/FliZ
MPQSVVAVVVFLLVMISMPWLIRWIKGRVVTAGRLVEGATRIVSAVAVGPHQRVVTVEVGPEGDRIWLVLGVTSHAITCLHSVTALAKAAAREEAKGGQIEAP